MSRDLANLAMGQVVLPSFGIAGDIRLSPEDGAAFVAELQRAFGEVLTRHGGTEGHAFRLAAGPHPPPVARGDVATQRAPALRAEVARQVVAIRVGVDERVRALGRDGDD